MLNNKEYLEVSFGKNVFRKLPKVSVSETIDVAFLKLYGDTELTEFVSEELSKIIYEHVDIIVGPESGGILLSHLISFKTSKPYVLARKKHRPNMINPLSKSVQTIGTKGEQKLWIDDDDIDKIAGKKVAIIDEVISSGATIEALTKLIEMAGGSVAQKLAVATEGNDDESVHKLVHLPIFERTHL